MHELWYVKARNVERGEEIQRLAALPAGTFGSFAAAAEMKAYLVETGRAKPDCSDWEIVEVQRSEMRSGVGVSGPDSNGRRVGTSVAEGPRTEQGASRLRW
jgi:hypothetical protein